MHVLNPAVEFQTVDESVLSVGGTTFTTEEESNVVIYSGVGYWMNEVAKVDNPDWVRRNTQLNNRKLKVKRARP